jgi:hypothetical protein
LGFFFAAPASSQSIASCQPATRSVFITTLRILGMSPRRRLRPSHQRFRYVVGDLIALVGHRVADEGERLRERLEGLASQWSERVSTSSHSL